MNASLTLEERPVNSLKPDTRQPRRTGTKISLDEMADSIAKHGVIQPIEIDENNVIIVGELRWRASRKAGLKTVPVRVVSGLSKEERFQRQVAENVARNEMTIEERADAVKILREKHGLSIAQISKTIGVANSTASILYAIATSSKKMKDAYYSGALPVSIASEVRAMPEDVAQKLATKVARERLNRSDARELAGAVLRNPRKSDEILGIEFDGQPYTARLKVNKIAPKKWDVIKRNEKTALEFMRITNQLKGFMEIHSPSEIAPVYQEEAQKNVDFIKSEIREWNW